MPTPYIADPIPYPSARVLLLDPRDRVLLFRTMVDEQELRDIWITPGGGLKRGESYEQAALRELWEETGLTGAELGPCVWTRRHVWRWENRENRRYESIERFFVVRTPEFKVLPAALEPIEAASLLEHRWSSAPEIEAASGRETFAPRKLGGLLPPIIAGIIPPQPIDTGP